MASDAIPHYKVVLLGEGRVGKTSLLLRYVDGSYVEGRPPTVQASYLEKHVAIEDEVNYLSSTRTTARKEAQLAIWDTAGQERFHSLGPIYYRDARGAVLVYDITDRPSFDRVKRWQKELRKIVGDGSKICLSIVGNKLDLERQRAVETKDAEKYASSVGANFLEVSAKTGSGVEKVFEELTKKMLDTVKPSHRSPSSLAEASNSMSSSMRNKVDEQVDLSQKPPDSALSKCC